MTTNRNTFLLFTPNLTLCQGSQIYWYQPGYALLYHSNAVNNIGTRHGALVVRNDDELRFGRELFDNIVELINIGIV